MPDSNNIPSTKYFNILPPNKKGADYAFDFDYATIDVDALDAAANAIQKALQAEKEEQEDIERAKRLKLIEDEAKSIKKKRYQEIKQAIVERKIKQQHPQYTPPQNNIDTVEEDDCSLEEVYQILQDAKAMMEEANELKTKFRELQNIVGQLQSELNQQKITTDSKISNLFTSSDYTHRPTIYLGGFVLKSDYNNGIEELSIGIKTTMQKFLTIQKHKIIIGNPQGEHIELKLL